MKRTTILLAMVGVIALGLSVPSASGQSQQQPSPPTKFIKHKNVIPNRYIVVLNDGIVADNLPQEVRRERVTAMAAEHAKTYGGTYDYIYETALKGYAITLPDEAAAIAISNLPEVRFVEEDALGQWDAPASTLNQPPVMIGAIGAACSTNQGSKHRPSLR